MAAGIIPTNGFPSPLPEGFATECENASVTLSISPDGLLVSDVAFVTNLIKTYSGSDTELAYHKDQAQIALDEALSAQLDFPALIKDGTLTAAIDVAAYIASVADNYTTLVAAKDAAKDVKTVIDLGTAIVVKLPMPPTKLPAGGPVPAVPVVAVIR